MGSGSQSLHRHFLPTKYCSLYEYYPIILFIASIIKICIIHELTKKISVSFCPIFLYLQLTQKNTNFGPRNLEFCFITPFRTSLWILITFVFDKDPNKGNTNGQNKHKNTILNIVYIGLLSLNYVPTKKNMV